MRAFFLDNLPLKVLSLFLALILFVLVREDHVKQAEVVVKVVTENPPENYVLVGEIPESLRLTVRGRWSAVMRAFERSDTPYVIDLAGQTNGDEYFFDEQELRRIVGTEGPKIVKFTPDRFKVEMKAIEEKRVPVRVDVVGEPARGYFLQRAETKSVPGYVVITGPKDEVEDIREVLTVPINIAGGNSDIRGRAVRLRRPAGRFLRLKKEQVKVDLLLEEVYDERIVSDVPVLVDNCHPASNCVVTPQSISVQVSGPLLHIEEFVAGDREGLARVDAGSVSEIGGIYEVPVVVEEHPFIRLTPTPTAITLKVEVRRPPAAPVSRESQPDLELDGGGDEPSRKRRASKED